MREPLCSPCAPRVSVVIADDYPVMREGLARLINDECDLQVSGSAATGRELRELISRQPPRVVVMEMLRDCEGLDLIKDVAALAPEVRIVVFSLHPEEIYAARCLQAGARAYVMKHEPVATLFRAIRDVAGGGMAVSPRVVPSMLTRRAFAAGNAAAPEARLTDRELQVFRLAGMGLPTREIAERLGVSIKTIETHREHAKNKLNLQSHAELVARAAQWVREHAPR